MPDQSESLSKPKDYKLSLDYLLYSVPCTFDQNHTCDTTKFHIFRITTKRLIT